MPWIVGIDEAGYGPNLGPFVMSAVACRVPERHAKADLWKVLGDAVRRQSDPVDERMLVADSKVAFSQNRGLAALEQTVHGTLTAFSASLTEFVEHLCPDCGDDIRGEMWYDGGTPLPVEAGHDACSLHHEQFATTCLQENIEWGPIRSVVVCPTAFNAVLDSHGSKGAVLASALVRLLRSLPQDNEPVSVTVDKHGGRNTYAAVLQPAFDGGLVLAVAEGSQESTYEVMDGDRQVRVTFQPRADAGHFSVALASMVSKYLRELLMIEFNRFWKAKLPNLKPTAGYPVDSGRFWDDIKSAVQVLGVAEDTLWRRK